MPTTRTIDAPKATRALRRTDPVLANLMKLVGRFDLQVRDANSVFAVLSEAIIYQQLHGRAAETIHNRVLTATGADGDGLTAAGILATSDEALRGAGLSRAKLASLRDPAPHNQPERPPPPTGTNTRNTNETANASPA